MRVFASLVLCAAATVLVTAAPQQQARASTSASAVKVVRGGPSTTGPAAGAGAGGNSTEQVWLTVAYCPDDFTSAGAVVSVDPVSGAWRIVGQFQWPDELGGAGCIILDDPNMTFSPQTGELFLDFTDDFGYVVVVDVYRARVTNAFAPNADFFPGFINFDYGTKPAPALTGITMTVTADGFCSDGCLGYGAIDLTSQNYYAGSTVPYKAGMDDTNVWNATAGTYYLQTSYPLTPDAACSPSGTDSDLCLVALSTADGSLKSTKYTNWTVYKYSQNSDAPSGSLMAFVEGFDNTCRDPYNNFAFATVNLPAATATLGTCVSHDAVIDMDEWDSAFNADDTRMATASGDAEAGQAQVLVFDTASGKALLNSRLTGLAAALGAAQGLFDVWDVAFAAPPSK